MRTAIVWAVTVTLVGALASCGSASNERADQEIVYCLARAQQARLADAADALRLAQPGGRPGTVMVDGNELSLADWHQRHGDDFDRACAAIRPADSASGWTTTLLGAFSTAIGAVLALCSAWLTARTSRRWQLCDSLRLTVQQVSRTVDGHLLERTGRADEGPTVAVVLERMGALDTALRRVRAFHRHREAAESALTKLDDLATAVSRSWPEPRVRDARAAELRAAAHEVQELVDEVASALDRPWRRSR